MARQRSTPRVKPDKELIIVVTAAFASQANTRAKEVDTNATEDIFTAKLSASGNLPATHYWCKWRLGTADDTSLRSKLAALVAANRARIFNGRNTTPDEVLTTMGLQRIKVGVNG